MRKKLKQAPVFRTEAEERLFWETHDSSGYVDWTHAEPVRFPSLKPSTASISLRLPLPLLERIKIAANKRDMPYQSLIKAWLAEKADTK
ncbi:MAG: BrnA antitoxin family protein [Pseudomonadota bacterium]